MADRRGTFPRALMLLALVSCGGVRMALAPDRDHDGIKDDVDLCPDQPENKNGREDWDGCPEPDEKPAGAATVAAADGDRDHDRILDSKDKCPDQPERYNGFEDDDGCPEAPPQFERPLPALQPAGPPPNPPPPGLLPRFQRRVTELGDLEYAGLATRLRLGQAAPRARLSFDVRQAKYYELVTRELKMTPEELKLLAATGVAGVDHRQRYGMGSAYYAIYARDLPVLVTTDSILHALHRSFDSVLEELETGLFTETIGEVLDGVRDQLGRAGDGACSDGVRQSLRDVDLYVTVARNLLAGGAALPDEKAPAKEAFAPVPSLFGQQAAVEGQLDLIRALHPVNPAEPNLRGERRQIDYSQFQPRGHYTATVQLRRYFRTMMWLGRPDLGFVVGAVQGVPADVDREMRAAVALVHLMEKAGMRRRLQSMSEIVDFMVGRADDLSLVDLHGALARVPVRDLEDLASARKLAQIRDAIDRAAVGRSQIQGQVADSNIESSRKTPPPKVLQLFAQRFGLDSFVLAQVVYDTITFRGQKQLRQMPSGLDVMASFGNDQAVSLLKPALDQFHYAANLLAARELVAAQKRADWDASLYGIWLDALRTLDDEPPRGALFPQALRTQAWRHKQLQTQLASWAELRHDTLLYLKQSYTVRITCAYPSAYVEPYPALFQRVRFLAAEAARRLRGADVSHSDPQRAQRLGWARDGQATFFDQFARRMGELEALARKELAGTPFNPAEIELLRTTINLHHGSGAPSYTGWYAGLFYAGDPQKWNPTVADVHTDINSGSVLEEAVGDATFLVVAIDNQKDRAVYVGPVYSYYELEAPMTQRMTDEAWHQRIESGDLPPRPDWTRSFQPPGTQRIVDGPPRGQR